MASVDWQSKSALKQLAESSFQYDFFAALRAMECDSRQLPRIGKALRPSDELVRLVQRPRMNFVASSIASTKWEAKFQKWEIDCQFFGLFGPQGALPIELTEYAMARIRDHRDDTFNRFVDCFYHRMMSFYYRAFASVEPTIQHDRPADDRIAVYLGSTIGIGTEELRDSDRMPDLAKLEYAGHLSQQNHHAAGLRSLIRGLFGVPVTIDEFVGSWLDIPEKDQLRLGADAREVIGVLGQSSMVGRKVWECQQCFRINIGPMTLEQYRQFLPRTENIRMLADTIKNYCGMAMSWVAKLSVKKEEVPELQLGSGTRLGWDSWLKDNEFSEDASDLEVNSIQLESIESLDRSLVADSA